jgi:hypothetical protein
MGLFCVVGIVSVHVALIAPSSADGKAGDGVSKPNPARDERLPPVLPGEVVKGDDGSEIKVWSSAGPVPSGHVPAPPGVSPGGASAGLGGAVTGGVGGVIVDGRGLLPNTSTGDATGQ